jgi:hypothetical protein
MHYNLLFSQFCVPDLVFYPFPNPVLFSPVRMLWILEERIAVSGPRISSKTLISMQGSRGWSMWCSFHKNIYCASAFLVSSIYHMWSTIQSIIHGVWTSMLAGISAFFDLLFFLYASKYQCDLNGLHICSHTVTVRISLWL